MVVKVILVLCTLRFHARKANVFRGRIDVHGRSLCLCCWRWAGPRQKGDELVYVYTTNV